MIFTRQTLFQPLIKLVSLIVLSIVAPLVTTANAIPRFDSGFHYSSDATGIMEDFLANGVPADVELLGFDEAQILAFYAERQYQPAFWQSFGWDTSMSLAFDAMAAANDHALNPADYASHGMRAAPVLGTAETDLAAFDAQATILFARYAHDIAIGRYNPDKETSGFDILADGMQQAALNDGQPFGEWFQNIHPNTPAYQRLIGLYRQIAGQQAAELPTIPNGPLLRQGIEHEHVPLLRQYMVTSGLMTQPGGMQSPLFDKDLDVAIRQFQSLAGLATDGIVGNQTRATLQGFEFDLAPRILVNLERLRWEAPLESDRYLRVNIANYRMQAYDDFDVALDMRVVVGRPDRQTPLMSDRITNLKFAPDWTVPRSIFKNDYLDNIRSDPGYVQSAGYQLKRGGTFIDPTTVNWADPNVHNQVTLYRPSSSYGPLGGVRFSLTNDQAIYLHDTSQPYLFDRAERDRSSGCVRVHDPEALSEFLLNGTDWGPTSISQAMNGNETSYARPNDEVQVYLSYMTVWVDDSGNMRTTGDPYDLDDELLPYFQSI